MLILISTQNISQAAIISIKDTTVYMIRHKYQYSTFTGCAICIWTIFESGSGIQISQATPTKFFMLFEHNYGKLGDHSLNFSFVHGPS